MTALDDMLAKADGQLRMCRERSPYATMPCESTACQMARALKAVAEALGEQPDASHLHYESDRASYDAGWTDAIDSIRAAIERRLTEGK